MAVGTSQLTHHRYDDAHHYAFTPIVEVGGHTRPINHARDHAFNGIVSVDFTSPATASATVLTYA